MAAVKDNKNQNITLGDVADVRNGYAFKSTSFSTSGIPVIKIKNMASGKINFEGISYYPNSSGLEKYILSKGDILVSMTGSHLSQMNSAVGKVTQYNLIEPALLNQRVGKIYPKNGLCDNHFLFYLLIQPQVQISWAKKAGGTANQANISPEIIKSYSFQIPEIEEQIKIGDLLGAYDDLLENNKKRVNALEEMAQLLYTEWFVKFKFPGHEEAKMVDSGTDYGIIPEGWEVKRLDEVIRIVRGRSYSSEQISDTNGDYYIVNLKSFNRGGGFRLNGAKYYSGQVSDDQLLKQGDIVVAVTDMTNDRAVIARPARIPNISTHKTTLSADVVKIVADGTPSSFIYYCLLDHRFTEATKHKANGANVLHLKPSAIGEYRALIPPIHLLKQFDALCKPPFDLIDKTIAQNADVERMRDLLIPQLVTGKREIS